MPELILTGVEKMKKHIGSTLLATGVALSSSFWLYGCSQSSEVNLARYSLTLNVAPESYVSPYEIKVKLAPMLDLGGVVIQISDVSMRPAKNYRYTGTLDNELSLLLADELNKAKIPADYKFNLFVSRFHGDLAGQAYVSFAATVSTQKKGQEQIVLQKSYNSVKALQEDGYEHLVTTLKQSYLELLSQLIYDLAATRNEK